MNEKKGNKVGEWEKRGKRLTMDGGHRRRHNPNCSSSCKAERVRITEKLKWGEKRQQ
jgi:hypothetical protein